MITHNPEFCQKHLHLFTFEQVMGSCNPYEGIYNIRPGPQATRLGELM